jgi:hypothetical protein
MAGNIQRFMQPPQTWISGTRVSHNPKKDVPFAGMTSVHEKPAGGISGILSLLLTTDNWPLTTALPAGTPDSQAVDF